MKQPTARRRLDRGDWQPVNVRPELCPFCDELVTFVSNAAAQGLESLIEVCPQCQGVVGIR